MKTELELQGIEAIAQRVIDKDITAIFQYEQSEGEQERLSKIYEFLLCGLAEEKNS